MSGKSVFGKKNCWFEGHTRPNSKEKEAYLAIVPQSLEIINNPHPRTMATG